MPSKCYPTPEAAVDDYLESRDRRDLATLRRAFLPDARLFWRDSDDTTKALTQLEWWLRIERTPAKEPPRNERTVIERDGPLALVAATSRWGDGSGFQDYLLVVATGRGFQIADKVFRRLGTGDAAPAGLSPDDQASIRAVLAKKIEAHAAYDPALLAESHLPETRYRRIGYDGIALLTESLSEVAARYADARDLGRSDRVSPWRVLRIVGDGDVAVAKLDVVYLGRRLVDHLLLVRGADGFRIVAAAWGPPEDAPHAGECPQVAAPL